MNVLIMDKGPVASLRKPHMLNITAAVCGTVTPEVPRRNVYTSKRQYTVTFIRIDSTSIFRQFNAS